MSQRNYPDSHPEFLDRVYSFTDEKWEDMPEFFSPYICSQFGWMCCGRESIKCVGCKRILNLNHDPLTDKLTDPEAIKCGSNSLQYLYEEVINGKLHLSFCEWPYNPSPGVFLFPIKELTYDNIVTNLKKYLHFDFCNTLFEFPVTIMSKILEKAWRLCR
ncbi:Nuclear-interacting partner of ALK [Thelohanellus kitauei]|uniref:Nuclear-interacting partner of ALK n=1 Tax=Thelohanellus kitauei TaxID=669202 RepID=A0A0C2N9Z9_THEKT|nr:Nuclear-interacting partner of ALK [Thelohanellus kitauei]